METVSLFTPEPVRTKPDNDKQTATMTSPPLPAKSEACRQLARQIENLLAAGFAADHHLTHFIDSTLTDTEAMSISRLLNNPDDGEAAVLIDLIVTPDAAICRQVESLLDEMDFASGDEKAILSLLPPSLTTRLHFPDSRGIVTFTLASSALERFIVQLNLKRKIPAVIRRALKDILTDQEQYLNALVAVRHSRIIFTPGETDFLVNFIRRTGGREASSWPADLDLILEILSRHQDQPDPFSALAAEKENCLKQVAATTRLEQQLTQKNIETVMMQKNGAGVMADKQSLFQRIGRIDTICLKVFGYRPSPAEPGPETARPASVSFLFEKNGPGD
ncbi:MAG: hypothetical protein ACOCPQ_05045 [Desulfosudaceae bacterium]